MAKFNLSLPTILIIAAIAWIFFFGGLATIQGWFAAAPSTPSGGQPVTPGVSVQCPDTLNTAYDGDVVNQLDSSTLTYIAAVGRFVPESTFNAFTAFTAGTSSGGGTAVNLRCGKAYKYYLLPTQDVYNPVQPVDFGVVSGNDVSRVIQVTNFSKLKATGYDNIAKNFVYDTSDATATDYDSLALTLESTTDNATGTALGIGSILDWTLSMETIKSVSQFGNSDVGVYIAVDADKTDYDAPLVQIDGVTLQDIKASSELSADDLAVLSSYEYIFKVPAGTNFQSAPKSVRLYVAGKAGVNPDADIVVRFAAKGQYVGADGFNIYQDIFNRASASEILTATAQTITIDVT